MIQLHPLLNKPTGYPSYVRLAEAEHGLIAYVRNPYYEN